LLIIFHIRGARAKMKFRKNDFIRVGLEAGKAVGKPFGGDLKTAAVRILSGCV
jgi:hypothetical protein